MNQTNPISIPIKPHIKKFVLFVMEAQEPFIVRERDILGRAIIKAIQETRSRKFDRVLDKYTARIKVVLTKEMRERSPMIRRIIHMNTYLEMEFGDAIILWVKAQRKLGSPDSEACKDFLRTLKIDETEYSYDAAYKVWQRYNVEVNKKMRSPRL